MELAAYGQESASGEYVSEQGALTLPAVWACVDLISKAGAVLPGHVFRRIEGEGPKEREKVRGHYLYPLVHDMANPTLPASEWRRLTLAHLLTWGNAYSWIEWTAANLPKALWIIPPSLVKVERKSLTGDIQYFIRNKSGQYVEFPAVDILHIRGLGYDGTVGYSPVAMLRNTMGLGLSSEKSAANLHKRGITARLIIESESAMTADQQKEFRESFQAAHGGQDNQGKAILLPNGMTAKPFSINPVDAQFLEQWQHTDSKIYQIYGVPPIMVGDTEKSTSYGTGNEDQRIGFVTFTVLPWMDLIETWLAVKLLPDNQKTHFVEYDFKGLLRADSTARSNWYRTMIETGAYSPNRILINENEDPYPGGDVYRRPLNTGYVNEKGEVVSITPPAGAPAQPTGGQPQ